MVLGVTNLALKEYEKGGGLLGPWKWTETRRVQRAHFRRSLEIQRVKRRFFEGVIMPDYLSQVGTTPGV